jgi:hypothetical protein
LWLVARDEVGSGKLMWRSVSSAHLKMLECQLKYWAWLCGGRYIDKYRTEPEGETANLVCVWPNNYLLCITAHDQVDNLFSSLEKLEKSLFVAQKNVYTL